MTNETVLKASFAFAIRATLKAANDPLAALEPLIQSAAMEGGDKLAQPFFDEWLFWIKDADVPPKPYVEKLNACDRLYTAVNPTVGDPAPKIKAQILERIFWLLPRIKESEHHPRVKEMWDKYTSLKGVDVRDVIRDQFKGVVTPALALQFCAYFKGKQEWGSLSYDLKNFMVRFLLFGMISDYEAERNIRFVEIIFSLLGADNDVLDFLVEDAVKLGKMSEHAQALKEKIDSRSARFTAWRDFQVVCQRDGSMEVTGTIVYPQYLHIHPGSPQEQRESAREERIAELDRQMIEWRRATECKAIVRFKLRDPSRFPLTDGELTKRKYYGAGPVAETS